MGCSCRNKRIKDGSSGDGGTYSVKLKGGMKVSKSSEAEARAFSAKHPGSTVVKG